MIFYNNLSDKNVITMNNTQDNMNNTIDKKEPIRLRGNKQPGAKDRPPNSKVGQGQARYNKGSFKR